MFFPWPRSVRKVCRPKDGLQICDRHTQIEAASVLTTGVPVLSTLTSSSVYTSHGLYEPRQPIPPYMFV
jgi:hypothetical protein